MPDAPLREKVKKLNEEFQRETLYALSRMRVRIDEEIRQPIFMDFLWVFQTLHDQRSRPLEGLWCRECYRLRRCIKSPRQGFMCVSYFLWSEQRIVSPMNTDIQRNWLKILPLYDSYEMRKLMTCDLFGVFFLHGLSLYTVVDFSKVALRKRIIACRENNSPYLLTL